MGKVKYQKRRNSTLKPKSNEKLVSFSSQLSSEEKKKSYGRYHQRRAAITPTDTSFHPKFTSLKKKQVLQHLFTDKGEDNLHLPKQSKKAKKRLLAKKKMAGAFGNMDSLADALPAVGEISKTRSAQDKPRLSKSKANGIELLPNIQFYHSVVQDPTFKANPWQAVVNYVNILLTNEKKESS